jgi:hypothetical protein
MMLAAAVGVALGLSAGTTAFAADDALPRVELNADHAGGRAVEELTKKSVARDYAKAWRTLATAMDQNRAELVDGDFVGIEADRLASAIRQQSKAGLHTRYVDRGHKVEVLFYSPEGLSIQLRDIANLEVQVLDGDTVIHREQATRQYISIMTPTEVRWKVRVLQAEPQ